MREEFRRRQKQKASSGGNGGGGGGKSIGGKEYWITSCRDMGMVDVIHDGGKVKGGGGEGIRFADDARMVEAAALAERERQLQLMGGVGGGDVGGGGGAGGGDASSKVDGAGKKKRKRKSKTKKGGAGAAHHTDQEDDMPPLPEPQMPPMGAEQQMPSLPPPPPPVAAVGLAHQQQHPHPSHNVMPGLPPAAAAMALNLAGSPGLGLGLGLGSLGQLGLTGLGGLAGGGGGPSVAPSVSPLALAGGTPLPILSADPNAAATAAAALLGSSTPGIGGGIAIGPGQVGASTANSINAEQLLLQQQHRQLQIQQQQIAQRMLHLQMQAAAATRASSAALSTTSSALAVSEGGDAASAQHPPATGNANAKQRAEHRPSSVSATDAASPNDAGNVLESKAYLLQFVDSVLMLTSALGLAYNGTDTGANRCGILVDAVDMDAAGTFSLDSAIGLLTNRALAPMRRLMLLSAERQTLPPRNRGEGRNPYVPIFWDLVGSFAVTWQRRLWPPLQSNGATRLELP